MARSISLSNYLSFGDIYTELGMSLNSTTLIECWVRLTSSLSGLQTIFCQDFDGSSLPIYFDLYDGTLRVGRYVSGDDVNATYATGWSSGEVHHIYGGYNGSAWILYTDGVLRASTVSASGPRASNGQNILIGYMAGAGGRPFPGDIAEVAVRDAALSDGEIAALASGFAAPLVRPSSVRAYCPLIRAPANLFGTTPSEVGSPGVAAHPRIIMPPRRRPTTKIAAAAGFKAAWARNSNVILGASAA